MKCQIELSHNDHVFMEVLLTHVHMRSKFWSYFEIMPSVCLFVNMCHSRQVQV